MISNPLKKIAQFLGFSTKDEKKLDNSDILSLEERRQIFKINEAYYNNNVYDRLQEGGALDLINDFLGEAKSNDIKGIFNPVKRIVEVYAQNVFAGEFGKDIKIKDTKDEDQPIHQNLKQYVTLIAKWSNFNQELKSFVRNGSLQGTVGIRVIAKLEDDYPNGDKSQRRVYIEFEHPATIVDALRDKRGNVKSIITEYFTNTGDLSLDGSAKVQRILIKELMTKDFIEKRTENNLGNLISVPFKFGNKLYSRIANALKVTPYVITQHERKSGLFGSWCFQGTERKIDMVNALSAHLDRQIIRHVKAVWAIASSGAAPEEFKFSGNNVLWFELDEGTSPPAIQSMVANLSISETLEKIQIQLDEIADSQPELKATDGKWLSGQSGETIAQLRLPAEQRIKAARSTYEDALIRAIKIALSWGILIGIFDFGTGSGEREAAEKAYNDGLLDFQFEERDALPITESERLDLQIKRNEAGALEALIEDEEETIQVKAKVSSEALEEGEVITEQIDG